MRFMKLFVSLMLSTVFLVACGGGDSGDSSTPAATSAPAAETSDSGNMADAIDEAAAEARAEIEQAAGEFVEAVEDAAAQANQELGAQRQKPSLAASLVRPARHLAGREAQPRN